MGNILKKGKLKKQVSHWKFCNTFSEECRPISDLFSSSIVNLDDNLDCDCKAESPTPISGSGMESLKTIDACSSPNHNDCEYQSSNVPVNVKEIGDITHENLRSSKYDVLSREERNINQYGQQNNQLENVSGPQKRSNFSQCNKLVQCAMGSRHLRNRNTLLFNRLENCRRRNDNLALTRMRGSVLREDDVSVLTPTRQFVSRLRDNHSSIKSENSSPFQIVSARSESHDKNGIQVCLKNCVSYNNDFKNCTLKTKRARKNISRQNYSLNKELKSAPHDTNDRKEQCSLMEVSKSGDESDISSMRRQPKDARCMSATTKRSMTQDSRETEDEVSFVTCSGNDRTLRSSSSDKDSRDFPSVTKCQKNINSRSNSCKTLVNEVTARQNTDKVSRFRVIRVVGNIEDLKRLDLDDSIIFHYRFLVKPDRDFWRIFACSLDRRIESICRQSYCRIHVRNVRADSLWNDEIAEISIFSETLHDLEKCCKLFDYRFPAFLASSGLGLMQ